MRASLFSLELTPQLTHEKAVLYHYRRWPCHYYWHPLAGKTRREKEGVRQLDYATEAEVQVEEALSKLSRHYYVRPCHWHVVADYLRGIRADSQRELDEDNPEDPQWHINHIH